jgi:hypothetical protein
MTPELLKISTAVKTQTASVRIDFGEGNGVVFTSKITGVYGNSLSVKIETPDITGPPLCLMDGQAITYRIPSFGTFWEASGPFTYNGSPSLSFGVLWYAGYFNDRWSFSMDGTAVSWPLDRDGEFVFFADGYWRAIKRVGGDEIESFRTDYQGNEAILYGTLVDPTPIVWEPVAPLSGGIFLPHKGLDMLQVMFLGTFTEGIPDVFIAGNKRANALVGITYPDGQGGEGHVSETSRIYFDGGR